MRLIISKEKEVTIAIGGCDKSIFNAFQGCGKEFVYPALEQVIGPQWSLESVAAIVAGQQFLVDTHIKVIDTKAATQFVVMGIDT